MSASCSTASPANGGGSGSIHYPHPLTTAIWVTSELADWGIQTGCWFKQWWIPLVSNRDTFQQLAVQHSGPKNVAFSLTCLILQGHGTGTRGVFTFILTSLSTWKVSKLMSEAVSVQRSMNSSGLNNLIKFIHIIVQTPHWSATSYYEVTRSSRFCC